jgi:imidazolonepropionase-like amidohydrolase/Tol biopolymer transport system component
MRRRSLWLLVASALLLAPAAAARTVAFDTNEVTEAAVALSPDGSTIVFTMLGHLFRIRMPGPGDVSAGAQAATAEQLTFGPSFDGDPAFSPDGSKLAFASDRGARDGNEFGIYLLNLATKEVAPLTREPFAIRPTFAASGDAVDYLATPKDPAPPGLLVLRRVALAGGEAKTLIAEPAPYRSIFRMLDGRSAWSVAETKPGATPRTRIETLGKDGRPVVITTCDGILERVEPSPADDGIFARRTQGGGSFGAQQTEDLVFIATGGRTTGTVRSIAPVETKSGPRPRIAVGPRSVVLVGDAGHIWRVDGSSGARQIVPMRAHVTLEIDDPAAAKRQPSGALRVIANPILMTDGRLIFEAAGRLWMQPAGDGNARAIEDRGAEARAFDASPALSRDEKRLAFVRSTGKTASLCRMDLTTGDVKTIASGTGYSQPAWSPDGSRLVFVESAGFSATVVSAGDDPASRQEIGQAGFWSARPNLSSDGQWLYTTADATGVGNVFRQPMAGAPGAVPVAVTHLTRHASDGTVSPDGKWLAFRRNKEIWIARLAGTGKEIVPLADADVRQLAEEGGDGYSFTADSAAVVYAAGRHVYRQPISSGARTEIPVHLDLPRPKPRPLLVRNVRLLDFATKTFGAPTSLLVDHGRIAWIGSERDRTIPNETQILNASGKFGIPGLFEMHAHAGSANQEAFIAYGVTSVRDTGGSIVGSNEIADRSESSDDPIPRYFFAGEIFEGAHPYWGDGFLQIQDADEARAYVRRFNAAGASFIKVYPSLPWPLQLAVIDEARKLGIPVAGHGMSVNEITRGVTHGFATVEHTVFPLRVYEDVILMLAVSGTCWDPTLAVVGGDSQLLRKDPARLMDAKLLALSPEWAIATAKDGGYEKDVPDAELNASWDNQLASLREAYQRGAKLAIGTDAPNPACFFGASLHWEMEFFSAAGIPPIEILRMATADAAKLVGAPDLGVIAPGKLADLVLLNASPLDDIKNTQSIWRTVKGGWIFDPRTLQAAD